MKDQNAKLRRVLMDNRPREVCALEEVEELVRSASRAVVIAPTQKQAARLNRFLKGVNPKTFFGTLANVQGMAFQIVVLWQPEHMSYEEGHPEDIAARISRTFGAEARILVAHGEGYVPPAPPVEGPKGWDGTGKPPAGTEVEYRFFDRSHVWNRGRVLCVGNSRVFFATASGIESSTPISRIELRPIRTKEEIAADKRALGIAAILADAGITDSAFADDPEAEAWAAALYDKGYSLKGEIQ
jgi:hypothetical protein